MKRDCVSCANCGIRTDSYDPFALVSEYRYGRMPLRDMRDHYGVCVEMSMLVPLDAGGEDAPCGGTGWEERCRG